MATPYPFAFVFLFAFGALSAAMSLADEADEGERLAHFEQYIRPALVEHCYECHSQAAGKVEGGLSLDSRSAMLTGGDSGPALVADNPEESLLLEALEYESFEMPPRGKLPAQTIDHFRSWIAAGAVDPRTAEEPPSARPQVDWEQAGDHWAFQPLRTVVVPAIEATDADWGRQPIDRFIAAAHRAQGLKPAPEAERATWLRRVSFDLSGLPPTVQQLDEFLADSSPDAYEQVVERLLASPHYGERWGKYWLDLARYADTNGADENHQLPHAWRFRDYVVAAFNSDKPYDRFVQEQLAGDLLPYSSNAERSGLLTATGFLVIGPKMLAEQDKPKLVADIVDEQLDTVGKVFLGLTLGCARCHDHKFDPISAKDYYSLAGIFHSTRTMEHLDHVSQWSERELPNAQVERSIREFDQDLANRQAIFVQRLSDLDDEIHAARALPAQQQQATHRSSKQTFAERCESLAQQVQQLAKLPKQRPVVPLAMAVDEAPVQLVAVHVRGNHLQFDGEPLPRSVPTIFNSEQLSQLTPPAFPEEASGRLALARWLTDPAHPLTARVMVNRVWQGHFGEGLVGSSSNFGLQGDLPSHPELLDWLALDFQRHGWSVKHLHRQIVLSSTYRMAWVDNPDAELLDPGNRLLWRQNRRRLDAESIRDLMLTIAGRVDHQIGGKWQLSPGQYPDSGQSWAELDSPRRTLLLPINRAALNEFFSTFDFVDPAASLEKRPATVVPHQTLFVMNHPLAMHAGWALAQRIMQSTQSSIDRVRMAYATILGRYPSRVEVDMALEFVEQNAKPLAATDASEAWELYCRSLLLVNETLYVD